VSCRNFAQTHLAGMSDSRFARLKSDPRFRRPHKKQSKVVIDDRFKHVLAAPKADKKAKLGIHPFMC